MNFKERVLPRIAAPVGGFIEGISVLLFFLIHLAVRAAELFCTYPALFWALVLLAGYGLLFGSGLGQLAGLLILITLGVGYSLLYVWSKFMRELEAIDRSQVPWDGYPN